MAQSYDIYFARMILTLGLVEREPLQGALNAYQQAGKAAGFPRWLVDHKLMDRKGVERVAADLERWFLAERKRALGFEDEAKRDPTEEGKPFIVRDAKPREEEPEPEVAKDESQDELGLPPDEESETPVVVPPTSSRPTFLIPQKPAAPGSSATRASSKILPTVTPGSGSRPGVPVPPPPPKATPATALPRPSGATPAGGTPRLKPEAARAETPPPSDHPPLSKRKSSATFPALDEETSPPVPRESTRLKKTSARIKPVEEPAEPAPARPRSASGRVKPVSGRLKTSSGITKSSSDKQWALYDKATKDPLSRLVGRRLGRTEIVKLLQTQEIVTTFEGRHGDDERGTLVKVLRQDKVKDKVALERFLREAQALSKIDHPNIARVLESGHAEHVRYMSMDVGSGEPLSKVIESAGRLPPDRAARIARGIALGLAAAHRAGIIHRDLRPANVLVEEGQSVKLMGFGVARDVAVPGRLTATGHVTGHPSYVAPELATENEVTPKADVYSLGIILFLALCGRLPFESRSVVKLVGLHLNAPPPKIADLAPGCPPRLAALVERLLAKDADKRPDAMEVANALAAKDLLEGFDDKKWEGNAKKSDTEEELRRALAADEQPTVDQSAERELGGPACAACELPLGPKSTSLHGNAICSKCLERVEALELCAACLLPVAEAEAGSTEVAVFAGHIDRPACTKRVRLPCTACKKEVALAGLASGQAKAKGDTLAHATCPR